MNVSHFVRKAEASLELHDLPADVLVRILHLLHGQDIARCKMVCCRFSALIRSDLHLQYKIELAQNGMVDGTCSTLSISERLHRLREYSERFCHGDFDYEDLTAHPLYVHQLRYLERNRTVIDERSLSTLYSQDGRSNVKLSVFTPGSAQAGIPSSRSLLPIGTVGAPGLVQVIAQWAIDGAQDLLVMAETAEPDVPGQLRRRRDEVHIRFYSLSCSKTIGPTPHPGAILPSLHISAPTIGINGDYQPIADIVELHISGKYVLWVLAVTHGELRSVFVEVCDWKTGEVISRTDVGTGLVNVIPLDYPYLLVSPSATAAYTQGISIYDVSPARHSRRIRTLQLPGEVLEPEEYIRWYLIYTGDRPETSEGHFLPDLSQSMVVLTCNIDGPQGERETYYLIPRATLLAQIREPTDTSNGDMESVPWANWGLQGCLRLRSRRPQLWSPTRRLLQIPLGSRFPLVVFDGLDYPSSKNASVYVFDVNPLVARFRKQVLAAARQDGAGCRSEGLDRRPSAIVDNIEEVLSDVVDAECSRIPYITYRFKLPYDPEGWPHWLMVRSVVMSTTGFTIEMISAV